MWWTGVAAIHSAEFKLTSLNDESSCLHYHEVLSRSPGHGDRADASPLGEVSEKAGEVTVVMRQRVRPGSGLAFEELVHRLAMVRAC
jgi:hypothetical protein